ESHNLRNREGKRYKAIKDYIEKNESKCILLTATPYNKTYLDISSQLRLFLSDEACRDLGIRPEKLLGELGEAKFNSRYQCPVRSLMAFEQSEHADDWRELMRHYLVRRTRSFIQENYARTDLATGRKYLEFSDGTRSYFPVRTPKTVRFLLNSEQQQAEDDPYALLYSDRVVTTINELNLPRYGLANYIVTKPKTIGGEAQILSSLSRGGKRLMGFCRTNLFKRLESGGPAFIQSLERHVLRNFIFLYAIENGLELPIGIQNVELLDTRANDQDNETVMPETLDEGDASTQDMTIVDELTAEEPTSQSEAGYRKRAEVIYNQYTTQFRKRFKWIRPVVLFNTHLKKDLLQDARKLLQILNECGHMGGYERC
ncbi:MAG TPA: hypothetical protein VHV10_06115, partial [Ktedonobacteraceae bacterium]|nr:hypothetical protein [Ktedonobacteraceae bacterium]